eukprot:COSAG01_NODE_7774_length_3063_cov_2.191970_3_plen_75_part_00
MHRRTTRPLRNPSSRKPRGYPLWLILLLFTCSIWARSHTSFCGHVPGRFCAIFCGSSIATHFVQIELSRACMSR